MFKSEHRGGFYTSTYAYIKICKHMFFFKKNRFPDNKKSPKYLEKAITQSQSNKVTVWGAVKCWSNAGMESLALQEACGQVALLIRSISMWFITDTSPTLSLADLHWLKMRCYISKTIFFCVKLCITYIWWPCPWPLQAFDLGARIHIPLFCLYDTVKRLK